MLSISKSYELLFFNNNDALKYIKDKGKNLDLMNEHEVELFEMQLWHYLQLNNKIPNPHFLVFPQDNNYTIVMHSNKKTMCACSHMNSIIDGIFYIKMFYVHEKYRNQGEGVALFESLELLAKILKAETIELQHTPNSYNFWLKMGFTDKPNSDSRMIKNLNN